MIAEIPLVVWVVLWMISGAASFIYWWTKDFDLTTREIPLITVCAIGGPLSWVAGRLIHGGTPSFKKVLLVKRRTGKEWYHD